MNETNKQNFADVVRPVFIELLAKEEEFKQLDICTLSLDTVKGVVEEKLAELDGLENKVMKAWAESTREINPTMMEWVQRGSINLDRATYAYLMRILQLEDAY